ncbi:MAG: RluA family pseudouridine synthase [Planctomycetota bacterium]
MTRYPREFQVESEAAGTKVETFVRRCLDADPVHVRKLLRQKRVRFACLGQEGEPQVMARGQVLEEPGLLSVLAAPQALDRTPAPNRKIRLRVIHEDPALLVIDKPAGLAMHPGPRHGTDTLLNGLVARNPECGQLGRERNFGLAHRLDLDTSGLLVVARTAAAHEALVAQFKQRSVEKRYLALASVGPSGISGGVQETPVREKEARTEIEVVDRAGAVALLSLIPKTGRTHQIRIHLAERHNPVLGDRRYGTGLDALTAKLYLKRLALHAAALSFSHPEEGTVLKFELPLPRDLRHSWKRARSLPR